MVKGDVHFLRAEWDQAEEYYRELLNPVGRDWNRLWLRLEAMLRLANLYLAKGQYEQALDVVSQAIDEDTAVGERKWLLRLHFRMATHPPCTRRPLGRRRRDSLVAAGGGGTTRIM